MRYRLFNNGDSIYIVDSDANYIFFVFPFLIWFMWLFSFNAYEIESDSDIKKEIEKKDEKKSKNKLVLSSSILSIILIRILPKGWSSYEVFPDNQVLVSICLGISLLALLIIRIIFSRKHLYKGKVIKIVKIRVSFFKYLNLNKNFLFVISVGGIICVLLLKELISQAISTGNPFLFLLILIIYGALMFGNQTIQLPNKYEIIFLANEKKNR